MQNTVLNLKLLKWQNFVLAASTIYMRYGYCLMIGLQSGNISLAAFFRGGLHNIIPIPKPRLIAQPFLVLPPENKAKMYKKVWKQIALDFKDTPGLVVIFRSNWMWLIANLCALSMKIIPQNCYVLACYRNNDCSHLYLLYV